MKEPAKQPVTTPRQFKDIVLEALQKAHPHTMRAADLQAIAEKEVGREFHPKTAGMTLYRLSQEGHAERIGKANWKYVPQEGEGSEVLASEPSMFS